MEENKNVLYREHITLKLEWYDNGLKECYLINTYGSRHYGKREVGSCHSEYTDYERLVWDLRHHRTLDDRLEEALYLKKGLFSKKYYVYDNCRSYWGDSSKIDRKGFRKLTFNREFEIDTKSTIQDIIQYLPVNELFLFAQDNCDGLKCYKTIDEYIDRRIKEENEAYLKFTQASSDLMQSIFKLNDISDVRAK